MFDAVLEIFILALAAMVILPLRMNWPTKMQAFTCFVLRIPYALDLHDIEVY